MPTYCYFTQIASLNPYLRDSKKLQVYERLSGTVIAGAGELLAAFAEENALATIVEKNTGPIAERNGLRAKRIYISHGGGVTSPSFCTSLNERVYITDRSFLCHVR